MPMILVRYLRWKVAIERIVSYLNEPDIDVVISPTRDDKDAARREATDVTLVADSHTAKPSNSKLKEERIGIVNGYFLWSEPAAPSTDNKKELKKPWWKRPFWRRTPSTIPAVLTSQTISGPATPADAGQGLNATEATLRESSSGTATPSVGTSTKSERRFGLKDINVFFPLGQLTLVTGPTASGKTALLRALLGEMVTTPPKPKPTTTVSNGIAVEEAAATAVYLPKRPLDLDEAIGLQNYVSYAAQTPWLENLSIKENIVFGSRFDEEKYQSVLECCALKPDLETFEDGDETEIGERGISLSGGQKARYVPMIYLILAENE